MNFILNFLLEWTSLNTYTIIQLILMVSMMVQLFIWPILYCIVVKHNLLEWKLIINMVVPFILRFLRKCKSLFIFKGMINFYVASSHIIMELASKFIMIIQIFHQLFFKWNLIIKLVHQFQSVNVPSNLMKNQNLQYKLLSTILSSQKYW